MHELWELGQHDFKGELGVSLSTLVSSTLTVAGSSTVTSRTIPAVSFTENPPVWNTAGWTAMKPNLASAVGACKVHIYPFGLLDPWASDASGKTEDNPSLWATGARLTQALTKIREMDANVPIILTLYGAMWWMKQTLFNNVIADLTSASQFSASGRVKNSQLSNWLILVDEAVQLAAAAGCRDFEIWNELKGFYDVNPHVGQTWDATMNSGNGVDNAVMGYSYFYQQTVAQVVATMTGLGISSGTYRIGGPYMLLTSQGTATANTVASNHAMYGYGTSWGFPDKAPINALHQFLTNVQANGMRLDTLLIDASTVNTDDTYVTTDPFALTKKHNDWLVYWRVQLATYGLSSDIPIDFSEIYAVPQPALRTTDSAALRTALVADMLTWCVLNRVRYPIMWGPTAAGTGGTGGALGGIVTTDGTMQGPGTVAAFFKINFAPGTAVYSVSSDNGQLGGIASATKLVVYNKTANNLFASVVGSIFSFAPYEVKLLTR